MVQINDKVRIIKIDERNLQVEEYRKCIDPKTKQESFKWKWVGYYGDLQSAFGGAIKHCGMLLADQDLKSVQEVIAKLDKIEKEVKSAVKGIKLESDNEA